MQVCIVEEIREWLESGQDYAQGVALYEKHGRSAVVRSTLGFGETEFTRAKLVHVLQQLVGAAPPAAVARPAAVPAVVPTAPPAPSVTIDPQRRDWFAERNHLHAQLGLVASDAERRPMALRILELADLISQSYAAEAGHNLATSRPEAGHNLATLTDEGKIRQLLANLRPQRSKLKKRPDRAADLAQVEADIALLEAKLK